MVEEPNDRRSVAGRHSGAWSGWRARLDGSGDPDVRDEQGHGTGSLPARSHLRDAGTRGCRWAAAACSRTSTQRRLWGSILPQRRQPEWPERVRLDRERDRRQRWRLG
jgi:hypothetical protein